jgi:hypothetical protein
LCYQGRVCRKPRCVSAGDFTAAETAFDSDETMMRESIMWTDKSLEDSEDLPKPDVLAEEIADDLEAALEQFQTITVKLKGRG